MNKVLEISMLAAAVCRELSTHSSRSGGAISQALACGGFYHAFGVLKAIQHHLEVHTFNAAGGARLGITGNDKRISEEQFRYINEFHSERAKEDLGSVRERSTNNSIDTRSDRQGMSAGREMGSSRETDALKNRI